VICRYSQG